MKTLMKSAALVSAIALTSTAAVANSFALQDNVMDDMTVTIDLVTSDTDGYVVIYDYTGGEFGDALGMHEVNAGANDDVIITLDNNIAQEFAAVLYNGEVTMPSKSAAWIELDIKEDS